MGEQKLNPVFMLNINILRFRAKVLTKNEPYDYLKAYLSTEETIVIQMDF